MLNEKLLNASRIKDSRSEMRNLADCIRIVSADAIEEAKSGHPGMPLGFADVTTVLAQKFLHFNPSDPTWFNRDRLILSAGHGSMLLYSLYYLCGYKDFTLDQIKAFRKMTSICAGHPEYGLSKAIETTTGPLGQGIGNAVGFAIAQKKYQAHFEKKNLGHICDYKIFCIVGDGCLMEGIAYESMSLAGHLNLNNLIILFDDNGISIDGATNLAVSENHTRKMQSLGFKTIKASGHNTYEIEAALKEAICSNKPSFISFKTQIGYGTSTKAGSAQSHGAPLGKDEINFLKKNIGASLEPFAIEDELLDTWRNCWRRNKESYDGWYRAFNALDKSDKEFLGKKELVMPNIRLNPDDQSSQYNEARSIKEYEIKSSDLLQDEATRISSGKILAKIMQINDKVICGSADLSESNNVKNEFTQAITSDDFSGNFIHFGVREHAMGAICNGLAISGFNPICSTFFVFTDYMRPAIRLSALMGLDVVYIMTHDSIGLGEDGPTHQPIEHLASFRAMPGINVYRPADGWETFYSYRKIASTNHMPSMLVLSRQKLANLHTANDLPALSEVSDFSGALILPDFPHVYPDSCLDYPTNHDLRENLALKSSPGFENDQILFCTRPVHSASLASFETSLLNKVEFAIFASGSEVSIAVEVKKLLKSHNVSATVISLLCMDRFLDKNSQGLEILNAIKRNARQLVAIEAGCEFGWHKIIGSNGLFFGINDFGRSAPAADLFEHYDLTPEKITNVLLANTIPGYAVRGA